MNLKFEMRSVGNLIQVYDDHVSLTPKGILGLLNKGLKGTKEIPFRSIVAVQFKPAGLTWSGYLQFTIPGGVEIRGGIFAATKDENTFMFSGKKNNTLVRAIKDYIDKSISALHDQAPVPPPSIAEELQKIAALKDAGALTDAEFVAAKTRLLQ